MSVAYVDTSALVKLIADEQHSAAMLEAFTRWELVSSRITVVEAIRAVRRQQDAEELEPRMRLVLSACRFIDLDDAMIERAGHIGRPTLRSLNALHAATAEALRDVIDHVVTYDARLAEAVQELGLSPVSPGAA